MISIPEELIAELYKDVVKISHLFTFQFTSRTFYLTDNSDDIHYNGHWYSRYDVKFDVINAVLKPEISKATFMISNVDKTFSDLCLSEEIRNKPVLVQRANLDRNIQVVGNPVTIWEGFTDEYKIQTRVARISAYNFMIRWKTLSPRRIHQGTCTWQFFKGAECAYAGAETWCDRTYKRCVALSPHLGNAVIGAIAVDGGVETDETTAANNSTSDDLTLLPSVPEVGDYYVVMGSFKFNVVKLNVSSPISVYFALGGGSLALAWEYWNSSAWATATVSDSTLSLAKGGPRKIFLNPPTDWALKTIQGHEGYPLRFRVTAFTQGTQWSQPLGAQAWIDEAQYLNFGGSRFLSELATKEVWWGHTQKSWINYKKARPGH